MTLIDRPTLCREAERTLSVARLNAYTEKGEADTYNAIARYLWNAALCEALYPTLQAFEVALRNAIHSSLSDYYRPEWLLEQNFFRNREWNAILDAQDSLSEQGKLAADASVRPDDLVAELMLGFWTGLFVHAYDRKFAIPVMSRGLKGFPDTIRTRDSLYKRFDKVRYLRNRVAHHEAIYHWADLPQRHEDVLNYIGYINPVAGNLAHVIDRFDTVHALGWKHYRTRMGDELLTRTVSEEAAKPPSGSA